MNYSVYVEDTKIADIISKELAIMFSKNVQSYLDKLCDHRKITIVKNSD